MTVRDFYIDFDYTQLLEINNETPDANLEEFLALGIDKVYFSGNQPAIFFKEVKQFNDSTLIQIAEIHHLAWNYRKVMFLVVVSAAEIRIYNCYKKPFNYQLDNIDLEDELKKIELVSSEFADVEALQTIKQVFSRIAVDTGLLWVTDNGLREKIDIQQRIDRYLVKSLLSAAKELKKYDIEDDVIHSLLMRSIFIMYLEDKGAASETKLYSEIIEEAQSYLDILEDKNATYTLFRKLQAHFNGNVFPLIAGEEKQVQKEHLKVIQQCLVDGDISHTSKLFTWRIFRFDIIQIELLSEIYENFLEEFKEKKKEDGGQYYTPPSLVELILNEKLRTKGETDWNVKILDPACGSGIFLVESFKRLVRRWKNAHPDKQIEFKDLREIIKENVFGIEYDKFAIRVTAFSLYLAMVEHLNPKTLWIDKRYKFPHLIFDPDDKTLPYQGNNLLRRDTIGQVSTDTFNRIDLVVGNPPFGSRIKLASIKRFCIKYGYGQDMVIPFLRKAADFAPEGVVALIFNTKILTNSEGPFQKFRKWLFQDVYVEKVYNLSIFRKAPKTFGGQLFSSAVGPVSIVYYQKNIPPVQTDTIEYWAPKTYIKNSLIEGVVIDSTDIKFLPRGECQKPNTKIWKIAMWGTYEDFLLIEKLNKNFSSLESYIKQNNIKKGVGFQLLTKSKDKPKKDKDIGSLKYLDADLIEPYYTPRSNLRKINDSIKTEKAIDFYLKLYNKSLLSELPQIDLFRRLGKKEAYVSPHLIIKKGTEKGFVCASYLDFSCSFRDGVYGFYGKKKDSVSLKAIVSYLNSIISNYYLFLSISSYGIEREQIMLKEFLGLPFPELADSDLAKIDSAMQNYIEHRKTNEIFYDKTVTGNIDEIFFDAFKLTTKEKYLIDDALNINIDLFLKGKDSSALRNVTIDESKNYGELLSKSMEEFLHHKQCVSVTVFDISRNTPLNLVILKFTDSHTKIIQKDAEDIQPHLNDLDKITLQREAKSIYVKKIIKYFDGQDSIYLIKPNQKRFWSRSMALNDARDLINDILKM
jgi:hypothetical protein